jgi:hypothetical protein
MGNTFFFNFWWKMILKIWLINLLFSVKKQNEKKKEEKVAAMH